MRKIIGETEEEFIERKTKLKKAIMALCRENIIDDDEFDRLFDSVQDSIIDDDEDDEDEETTLSLKLERTTIDDVKGALQGMILHDINPLYSNYDNEEQTGKTFTFRSDYDEDVSMFRKLLVQNDGEILISEEY